MRRIVVGVLSLCMLASPAAFAGGAGNADPSAATSGGNSGTNSAGTPAANSPSNSGAPAAPSQPAAAPVNPSPSSAELQSEIDEMRSLVQAQSEQIQKQQKELAEMKAKLAGNTSNSPAQPAPSSTISTAAPSSALPAIAAQPSVPAAISTPASTIESSSSLSTPGSPAADEHSPLFFKIGDAKFTPGGFMDAMAVFRTTGHWLRSWGQLRQRPIQQLIAGRRVSPRRASAFRTRASRCAWTRPSAAARSPATTRLTSSVPRLPISTSRATPTRLRSRLYFADYNRGHWEFLAGQTWSMLTPGRNGISPWPGDIFYSQDVDTNYQVGLTWARQLGFRVVYHPNKVWALGLAVENPDQLVGGAETFPDRFRRAHRRSGHIIRRHSFHSAHRQLHA